MNEMMFPVELIEYLDSHTLIEIKGGVDRETFLKIWMVSVDNRIFARSWTMSSKSWFTEFVKQEIGQLKFGENVITVSGKQLFDDELNRLVDQAYKQKYTQQENIIYVNGITESKYHNYTMEFFYLNTNE